MLSDDGQLAKILKVLGRRSGELFDPELRRIDRDKIAKYSEMVKVARDDLSGAASCYLVQSACNNSDVELLLALEAHGGYHTGDSMDHPIYKLGNWLFGLYSVVTLCEEFGGAWEGTGEVDQTNRSLLYYMLDDEDHDDQKVIYLLPYVIRLIMKHQKDNDVINWHAWQDYNKCVTHVVIDGKPRLELVRTMLACDAITSWNELMDDKQTVLHVLAESCAKHRMVKESAEVLLVLLESGKIDPATIDATNTSGHTTRDIMVKNRLDELVAVLDADARKRGLGVSAAAIAS